MKKGLIVLVSIAAVLVIAGIGGYVYLTAPTKGPSGQGMMPPPGGPGGNRQPPAPLAQASAPQAEPVTLADGQTLYAIDASKSVATFTLDEQLRGQPKTVIGTSTGMIAGQIGLDAAHPSSSTVGTVTLNARTFVTDDNSRNNMIRRAILKTENDANEFITFQPTVLDGLPASIASGTPFAFQITGNLTIAGVTKPETFDATAVLNDDGTLGIDASTTVSRADFNLVIPNIPFIANVTDNVVLDLDLVAAK